MPNANRVDRWARAVSLKFDVMPVSSPSIPLSARARGERRRVAACSSGGPLPGCAVVTSTPCLTRAWISTVAFPTGKGRWCPTRAFASLAAHTRSQSIRPDNLLRSACSTSTGDTVTMPSTSATFQGSVTGTLRWRTVARNAQRRAGSRATLRLKIGEAAQISLQAAVLVSAGGPVRNSR